MVFRIIFFIPLICFTQLSLAETCKELNSVNVNGENIVQFTNKSIKILKSGNYEIYSVNDLSYEQCLSYTVSNLLFANFLNTVEKIDINSFKNKCVDIKDTINGPIYRYYTNRNISDCIIKPIIEFSKEDYESINTKKSE